MKLIRVVLLLLLLLPLSVFAGRQAEMIDPPVVDIPQGVSQERAMSVARRVLKDRDWVIQSSGDGQINARYSRADFNAKIAVVLSGRTLTIKYVDSKNLNYEKEDGKRLIHPNFNRWMRNLEKDLNRALDD